MFSEKMAEKGRKRSAIREIFEYALKRKEEIGADNVFDFSIGNPSVPAPEIITDALIELIRNTDPVALHGYTSAQGDKAACKAVACRSALYLFHKRCCRRAFYLSARSRYRKRRNHTICALFPRILCVHGKCRLQKRSHSLQKRSDARPRSF